MNWEHLKTFLWLRWRIISNRNRRAGAASVVLQSIFIFISIAAGLLAFIGGIAGGLFGLPQLSSPNVMLVWDAVVVLFLFFWMTELMIELQRSELLSLDKFLHLPVSLSSAFLINYVGSISSAGAFIFLPMMIGLAIGLVFSKGLAMILLFPLIAAFALDGNSPDSPVPGMAGEPDGQPTAAPYRYQSCDTGFYSRGSDAQHHQFRQRTLAESHRQPSLRSDQQRA